MSVPLEPILVTAGGDPVTASGDPVIVGYEYVDNSSN